MASKTYPTHEEDLSPHEMIIGQRIYDVSKFQTIHPGGSIINFYLGTDATLVWGEFHSRSEKSHSYLKSLPSRPLSSSKENQLTKDYLQLRQEFEKEGLFDPVYPHIAYRIFELLVLHAIGLYLLCADWPFLGILIYSIADGRVGWFMHECGHLSMTGNSAIDKPLQSLSFALGNMCSGSYWNNQHNKHHAAPQKLKHDVYVGQSLVPDKCSDLRTLPLVSFNKEISKDCSGLNKLWLSAQAYLFVPLVTFLVVMYWACWLHPRFMFRNGLKLEMAGYLIRCAFVCFFLGAKLFALNALIGGSYIFLNFALSHTHTPVIQSNQHPHWVQYAANHTVNIADTWAVNWWMGYLNFQIEHHLFPSMPQVNHPKISKRVKALFQAHGLEYRVLSYWEGLVQTFGNLYHVGH